MNGLLGGPTTPLTGDPAAGSNVMGSGLLNTGAPVQPQQHAWAPGYGGSRWGGGTQPGGYLPPQAGRCGVANMQPPGPPQFGGGYGLMSPWAQY